MGLNVVKAAALGALLCLVGCVTIANPASAAPKDFTVSIERLQAETVDTGETGSSIGDIWVSRGEIFAWGTSRKIGSYSTLHVVVTPAANPSLEERSVQAEFRLPGGVISTTVILDAPTAGSPIAAEHIIVGGTGKYFGVRGTAMITSTGGKGSKIRFRFAP